MKGIKMPPTIRWAITNCLLIWITMSLYRGFLLGVFIGGSTGSFLAFFSGMLADAGVLSFILVIYILLSLIPSLHPFKSTNGKLFGYIYFIIWGLLIATTYAFDLVFVKTLQYRIYGSKILEIIANPDANEVILNNFTLTPLIFVIVLILWIWGIIIVRLHGYIGSMPRVHDKAKRITWKGLVIITCTILVALALFQGNGIKPTDLNIKTAPYYALKANPILSFFFI